MPALFNSFHNPTEKKNYTIFTYNLKAMYSSKSFILAMSFIDHAKVSFWYSTTHQSNNLLLIIEPSRPFLLPGLLHTGLLLRRCIIGYSRPGNLFSDSRHRTECVGFGAEVKIGIHQFFPGNIFTCIGRNSSHDGNKR